MRSIRILTVAGVVLAATGATSARLFWGEHGHIIVGQAAANALPADMPEFFRKAGPQLAYLNPEPDRWRNSIERAKDPAMDGAHSTEHYVDFEKVPGNALAAPTRLAYLDSLHAAGIKGSGPGLLSFTALEVWQRLRVGFRDWRGAPNDQVRLWIEDRIINDAGILGHYVADGSNPHHTTQHHDRWIGENPRGFTTERGFHSRFESQFVQARINLADVTPRVARDAVVRTDARREINQYLRHSFSLVERLYELDKQDPFNARNMSPEHKAFAAERLAAAATMLRDLWYTAWVTSADTTRPPR